jgi:hypothetical protein
MLSTELTSAPQFLPKTVREKYELIILADLPFGQVSKGVRQEGLLREKALALGTMASQDKHAQSSD